MGQDRTPRVTARTGAVALVLATLAGLLAVVGLASPAGADITSTSKNTAAITIPDSGKASPYPSTITATGLNAKITGLKVVIRNTTHGCAKDLDVLLVGPTGQSTVLFSDNGHPALIPSCADLTKSSITIDDSCPDFSNSVPGGADICVRPSDNDSTGHQGDNWDVPGSHSALNLSTFNGSNPNGAWNLYVVDDSSDDSGSFAGGWELQITTANTAPTVDAQVIQATKGVAVPFTVTGTDPDGGVLTCQVPAATQSAKGTLGGSGCARTFTAVPRAVGTDKVTVTMTDPAGAKSAGADISFNIVNRIPTANDQTITVGRGERVAIALGGTDPDPGESFALTCQPTTGPTGLGKVTGSGCNVTYEANQANGTESFPFVVSDGFGGTEAGSVTVTVGDPNLPGCTPADSKNARYVCRVYLDLLGRSADPGGKAYWLKRLDRNESRLTIIRQYQTTPEYRRTVVDDVFRAFLNRPSDAAGRTYWAEQIRKGANPDKIRSQVISSSEYYTKAGSSAASFVAAAHQQVLRRPATANEISAISAQLANGTSRASVASKLLASREGDTATVAGIYERYLRRTPQPAPSTEASTWINKLQAGTTELKVVEAIVGSNEYYNRA